ncbi:MAG: ubiquitin-like domain-containing protein [Candidatus Zixiibacteriota bacterium]|jgi:hypothetical protein
MKEDRFKLPRSSYDEIIKIVKAYNHLEKAVFLKEVQKITSMHDTVISRNIGFLLALDIIEGGKQKAITEKGRELGHALEHEIEPEIQIMWYEIVKGNDFLMNMVQALKVRNGMGKNDFKKHIAYSAGEGSSKEVLTGAGTIIEILNTAGLTYEDGDRVIPERGERIKEIGTNEEPIIEEQAQIQGLSYIRTRGYPISILININVSLDELEELPSKIRELKEKLSEQEE